MTRQPLTDTEKHILFGSAVMAAISGVAVWFAIWNFYTAAPASNDGAITPVRPAWWPEQPSWLPPAAVCGFITAAVILAICGVYFTHRRGGRRPTQ